MGKKPGDRKRRKLQATSLGLIFGGGVGLVFEAIGLVFGAGLGLLIGAALDASANRRAG